MSNPPKSEGQHGGAGKELGPTVAVNPSETTLIVISHVPTSLAQVLSSLSLPTGVPSTTGVQITVTRASSILDPTQLSSSVRDALTSGGVPSADASALVSAIIGNFGTSVTIPSGIPSGDSAAIMSAVQQEQRELQASIEAFIQWLLHFLHLA
ncbi:MAG: hypothetical protein Q9203_002395 [Teloschistes exilis]